MAPVEVIVAGHMCLDITPKFCAADARTFSELLVPGTLVNLDACVVSTGGPVPNTGLALLKLGVKTRLMGKVGDDILGQAAQAVLDRYEAGGSIVVSDAVNTSYSIVLAPPGVDRIFLHHSGANDTFGYDDVDFEALEKARLFHLGYPPIIAPLYENEGRELERIFREAKRRGATTSLDMTLPDPNSAGGRVDWRVILQRALPYVDLFLPSIEEITFCLRRRYFDEIHAQSIRDGSGMLELIHPNLYGEISQELLGMGAGVAALKAGLRGLYLRTSEAARLNAFGRAKVKDLQNWSNREIWEPIFLVERVASATGAGDCSIAGFLASFLRSESIEEAVRFAAAAGAQNVTEHDAISGIRSIDETRAQLKDWKKVPLDLSIAEGWRFDATRQLWHGPKDARP